VALLRLGLIVAAVGVLVEMVFAAGGSITRPNCFSCWQPFGLTLMVEDLVVLIWGPERPAGAAAPRDISKARVDFFGPEYSLPTTCF